MRLQDFRPNLNRVEIPIGDVAKPGTPEAKLLQRADDASKKRGIEPNQQTSVDELERYLDARGLFKGWRSIGVGMAGLLALKETIETRAKEKLAEAVFAGAIDVAGDRISSAEAALKILGEKLDGAGDAPVFTSRREYVSFRSSMRSAMVVLDLCSRDAASSMESLKDARAEVGGKPAPKKRLQKLAEVEERWPRLQDEMKTERERAERLLTSAKAAPAEAAPEHDVVRALLERVHEVLERAESAADRAQTSRLVGPGGNSPEDFARASGELVMQGERVSLLARQLVRDLDALDSFRLAPAGEENLAALRDRAQLIMVDGWRLREDARRLKELSQLIWDPDSVRYGGRSSWI